MKVVAPFFSQNASGTVGGVLTFSKRKSGQQCRYQKKQAYFLTDPRQEVSNTFKAGANAWNDLTDEEKEEYNEKAKNLLYTGYDLFIKEYFFGLAAVYGVDLYGDSFY